MLLALGMVLSLMNDSQRTFKHCMTHSSGHFDVLHFSCNAELTFYILEYYVAPSGQH